uniref:Helicase ATP-binding domain-containing protein n=1 Tax=viral metagenome TaxID=1070528 RepID=A0A6C0HSI1_9ZZZZ
MAYIGNKGYTVFKKDVDVSKIKAELTAVISCKQYGTETKVSFFRESLKKLYLPRFYGIKKFGSVTSTLLIGDSIDIKFAGTLRPIQDSIVNSFFEKGANGLIEVGCGQGKTICALNIIQKQGKKTLVIVHKEFLLNQWVERIEEFLPSARIGRIQGNHIDIDDKDIVIGMLQSLSMKDYDISVFSSFGFIVIDEVHHISSEVFSNFLFNVVKPNMLGLSATMERKDGTTPFFKLFLGDVVYKQTEKEKFNVTVRAYNYTNADPEFNEVETDMRGNVKYSTMITKLCSYNHRSEFILDIITKLLDDTKEQQIMVIAHNKNILKYMYDAIVHRSIASVGYYVGGMKETELKATETKKIIIATYSMAAEALDIKTLNILVMVTPKTEIEQVVGRILRVKHSTPIVVDIIDSHTIFKNQWKKRRTFYNKNNYKIQYMDSKPKEGCLLMNARL